MFYFYFYLFSYSRKNHSSFELSQKLEMLNHIFLFPDPKNLEISIRRNIWVSKDKHILSFEDDLKKKLNNKFFYNCNIILFLISILFRYYAKGSKICWYLSTCVSHPQPQLNSRFLIKTNCFANPNDRSNWLVQIHTSNFEEHYHGTVNEKHCFRLIKDVFLNKLGKYCYRNG